MLFTILSLGSCHKDKIKVDKQTQIVMGASSTYGTKAVIGNKDQLVADGSPFGVFGYKTVSNSSDPNNQYRIFNNTQVSPSVTVINEKNDTAWTYSPIRYWDSNPNVSYQFIAYWPWVGTSSQNGPYVEESSKLLTIHNIPNWQDSVTALDIMTSTRMGKYRGGNPNAFGSGTVVFNFSHILSKIVIKGYYIGDKNTHITIKKITLKGSNFLLSTGKADYTEGFNENSSTTPAFSTVSTGNTAHVLFDDTQENVSSCVLPETSFDDETPANLQPGQTDPTPYTPARVCTWLTIPSGGWQNLLLTISYCIGDSSPQEITTSTPFSIGTNSTTEKAKSYVITLKFDSAGGGVDVGSVNVKDWVNQDVTHDVFNW